MLMLMVSPTSRLSGFLLTNSAKVQYIFLFWFSSKTFTFLNLEATFSSLTVLTVC